MIVFLSSHAFTWLKLYGIQSSFYEDIEKSQRQKTSKAELPVDASSVNEAEARAITSWIEGNSKEPMDYLVDFAKAHQAILVGEVHGKLQFLELLNSSIERLYHEAGVRDNRKT